MPVKPLESSAARTAKNLLAVAVGLVAAAVLLEGGARLFATALGVAPYMRYDDTLGWTAMPGATKHHIDSTAGFDVTYEINAHGYRGSYYERAKPPGTFRVVVLGDSNAFGWGIREGEHFAALLDETLDEGQVINLALSGYGTDQEYLRLHKEGLGFEPDLVILQVTPNDFDEIQYPFYNQKPKPQFTLSPDGEPHLTNVPVHAIGPYAREFLTNSLPLPFREWLGWHSYSYTLLNEKYYGLKRRYTPGSARPLPRFSRESIELFSALVALIDRTTRERGARLLIVHADAGLMAQGVFAHVTVPVLDMSDRFFQYSRANGRSATFPDGFHWSAPGHRIVAEEIAKIANRIVVSKKAAVP